MTQQEEQRQKYLERLKTLRPIDDDFMRATERTTVLVRNVRAETHYMRNARHSPSI